MPRRNLFVFLSLTLLPALYAQEFRGTLTGRVVDAQSAAVPNARIVAVQVATGGRSITLSGSDGLFTIPFLSPGTYRVEADSPGLVRVAAARWRSSSSRQRPCTCSPNLSNVCNSSLCRIPGPAPDVIPIHSAWHSASSSSPPSHALPCRRPSPPSFRKTPRSSLWATAPQATSTLLASSPPEHSSSAAWILVPPESRLPCDWVGLTASGEAP